MSKVLFLDIDGVVLPAGAEIIYDHEGTILPCGARLVIVSEEKPQLE